MAIPKSNCCPVSHPIEKFQTKLMAAILRELNIEPPSCISFLRYWPYPLHLAWPSPPRTEKGFLKGALARPLVFGRFAPGAPTPAAGEHHQESLRYLQQLITSPLASGCGGRALRSFHITFPNANFLEYVFWALFLMPMGNTRYSGVIEVRSGAYSIGLVYNYLFKSALFVN